MSVATHPELALIVGAARSGTTLTRLLLDAHPDVSCPPEVGLPALMGHMARIWDPIDGDEAPGGLSPAGREWTVSSAQQVMDAYCAPKRARLFCDKSLDSVTHLELVRELFPQVRVVLVFRHVMDTIASGVEASPWGFQAYGYGPYVQVWPGNSVAALASYWLDHVRTALAWEQAHPEYCHRVRYEDLVLAPEATVTGMQRFLGLDEDLSVLRGAFDRERVVGPGDYKAQFKDRVDPSSIGHGKRVPVDMLPAELLASVNEQLTALGYPPVNASWNRTSRPVDGGGSGQVAEQLAALMARPRPALTVEGLEAFAVVADDHRPLRWVVEPASGRVTQGDGEVDAVFSGLAEDLVQLIAGAENPGLMLRTGRLRHVIGGAAASPRASSRTVADVVAFLRSGA
jgi:protein-tyrosine sulfotransferase